MNRVLPTLFGSARHYKTGALYAFEWGDSSYGVAKMLRRDFGGIHVRIYANSWQERPTSVASETLGLPFTRQNVPVWDTSQ